ncbi:hypothetical protein BegalDRAFT_0948 [Beggiatoa alba B18LD]|uniref:Uncharacterized protein n=1 Tax=Beggiatoa alba B18LD TaxID=395493 RepID=I3CE12_9GAMM|nr:major capsid protein [Beggiatoa alba]EIJ41855.1 hypothetical protein BegalDRAFT_0948 [Beggiatoa alba B18LD]
MQILKPVMGLLLFLSSWSVSATPFYLVVDDVVDQIAEGAFPVLAIGLASLTILAIVAMIRWARGAM